MATTTYTASMGAASEGARARVPIKQKRTPGAKKLRLKELPPFTRQLAAMLSSGMPVVQTLEALEEQTSSKLMQKVIADLRV